MSEALEQMAQRAASDPFFLACPLAEYARSEHLDDPALAARLGLRVEDLTRLRLCRAPRPDGPEFRADVTEVATAFGIEPTKLAAAVRHGESLAQLRAANRAAVEAGHVIAARDGEPEPPPEKPS